MAEQKKEFSKALVDAIKNHIPLHTLNDFLKKINKQTANSWDKLFAKHSGEEALLTELLTEVLSFGNKSIIAYNIQNADADKFNLDVLDIDANEIGILQALKTENAQHILFRKRVEDRFLSYTFICRKPAIETYVLTKSDLTNEARDRYWDPSSEIRVKTNKLVTVFDSVIHDRGNNIVFFIIDNLNYSFEKSAFEMHAE